MPSVCPSSEKSHRLYRCVSSWQGQRYRSRGRSPRLPAKLACLLRHPDAAEEFMRGWLSRFHCEHPRLYTVLAARRTEVKAGGMVRRLVIEAAMFQPQRRGASPEWLVICWCIDGPGVVFHRLQSSETAIARMLIESTEHDVVFSSLPSISRSRQPQQDRLTAGSRFLSHPAEGAKPAHRKSQLEKTQSLAVAV